MTASQRLAAADAKRREALAGGAAGAAAAFSPWSLSVRAFERELAARQMDVAGLHDALASLQEGGREPPVMDVGAARVGTSPLSSPSPASRRGTPTSDVVRMMRAQLAERAAGAAGTGAGTSPGASPGSVARGWDWSRVSVESLRNALGRAGEDGGAAEVYALTIALGAAVAAENDAVSEASDTADLSDVMPSYGAPGSVGGSHGGRSSTTTARSSRSALLSPAARAARSYARDEMLMGRASRDRRLKRLRMKRLIAESDHALLIHGDADR